jgi:hypothetical protein
VPAGQTRQLPPNPQLGAYLNRLSSKAYRNWYLPDGSNHVSITADLQADGSSNNLQATSSPKSEPAEQAALDAFGKVTPLDALPPGVKPGKLTVNFDSKADPHGDSKSNITARFDPFPSAGKVTTAPQSTPEASAVSQPAATQAPAAAATQAPPVAATQAPAAAATQAPAAAATQAPAAAATQAPAAATTQAMPAATQTMPDASQAAPTIKQAGVTSK